MRRRRMTSANSTRPPCHPAGTGCRGRAASAAGAGDAGHRHGVPRLESVPKLQLLPAVDVDVELSGGIRDDASLTAALATGCRRVNLGTAALESPEWCARAIAEHGDRIAVGLDVRGTRLAARGWTREGGELYKTLARLDAEGCARYVVTDITKDGTLRGPNLQLLREVCAATPRPVIASGGVSSLDDIRALAALAEVGVEGAIVGKALYAGQFTLPEALAVTEQLA